MFDHALLQVMRSFLADSVYSNMAPLFTGPTVLLVSKEPKAKEMLATLKHSPQMVLLGMYVMCDMQSSHFMPFCKEYEVPP